MDTDERKQNEGRGQKPSAPESDRDPLALFQFKVGLSGNKKVAFLQGGHLIHTKKVNTPDLFPVVLLLLSVVFRCFLLFSAFS